MGKKNTPTSLAFSGIFTLAENALENTDSSWPLSPNDVPVDYYEFTGSGSITF